jgi:membrane-associated HD superfamily phosphohydrolase
MRAFNILFIILFILFACLQYNDPDPYIWVSIYLYAAFLCYIAITKRYNPILYIFGLAVYLSYGLYLFFEKSGVLNWATEHNAESIIQMMKAEKPWIEATREFGGLMIVIIVLLINLLWLRKNRKPLIS